MATETDTLELPPTEPNARRAWFKHELSKHTNPETTRPWLPADVARDSGTSESHVSLVLGGTRKTGPGTKSVHRTLARVLKRSQAELFGHVCDQCTHCGAPHPPRRTLAQAGDE